MSAFICRTCAVQHAESESPPERCIICDDERQYVPPGGQKWTTLEELRSRGHQNVFEEIEPGLTAIHTKPRFGIGQRSLLVQTDGGNFLWDCLGYIDAATVERIEEMGGVQGISASHPHFYGSIIEWSQAFGGASVYLPEADREWVVRPDPAVHWYEGVIEPWPGLTVVQCGGHFAGSAVVHWPAGADGRGALLTGDTIAVAQDRRFVTFMRSYPNYIPLPEPAVRGIMAAVRPYEFDRIYGGWIDVEEGGKGAVERSAERYIRWISGEKAGDARFTVG